MNAVNCQKKYRETVETNPLRWSCSSDCRIQRIRNEDIRRTTICVMPSAERLDPKQLWYGYVMKIKETRWPRRTWKYIPDKRRRKDGTMEGRRTTGGRDDRIAWCSTYCRTPAIYMLLVVPLKFWDKQNLITNFKNSNLFYKIMRCVYNSALAIISEILSVSDVLSVWPRTIILTINEQ